jgi:hypothetical protein
MPQRMCTQFAALYHTQTHRHTHILSLSRHLIARRLRDLNIFIKLLTCAASVCRGIHLACLCLIEDHCCDLQVPAQCSTVQRRLALVICRSHIRTDMGKQECPSGAAVPVVFRCALAVRRQATDAQRQCVFLFVFAFVFLCVRVHSIQSMIQ